MSSSNRPLRQSARQQAAKASRAAGELADPPVDLPSAPAPAAPAPRRPKRTAAEVDSPDQNSIGRTPKRAKAPAQPKAQSSPASEPPNANRPSRQAQPSGGSYSLRKRHTKAPTMSSPEYVGSAPSMSDDPQLTKYPGLLQGHLYRNPTRILRLRPVTRPSVTARSMQRNPPRHDSTMSPATPTHPTSQMRTLL